MSNVQTIKTPEGEDAYAVLPIDEYNRLVESAAMLEDIAAYDSAKAALAAGEDELVPDGVTDRLLDDENPIRVWREHRGLTQEALASAATISRPHLVKLEAGEADTTVVVLAHIARVLGVDIMDLAKPEQPTGYTDGIPDRCPACGEDSITTEELSPTAKAAARTRITCVSCDWGYVLKR